MNMKSLSVVLGAFTMLALGACKVTTTGSSSTGEGGSGTGTTTTGGVGGSGGSGGAATTATGTGGAPACDAAYTCAEAITPPNGDAKKLCDGPHGTLYDALNACTCTGACKTACEATACAGLAASPECTTCLQAAAPDGCKKEFDECSNDI
jgi:hypothetical protein